MPFSPLTFSPATQRGARHCTPPLSPSLSSYLGKSGKLVRLSFASQVGDMALEVSTHVEQFFFGSWFPSGLMSELDPCCAADGPVPCVILSTVAGGAYNYEIR